MQERKDDFEKLYSELEAKLNNAIGKQVLVVENKMDGYGCGGSQSSMRTTLEFGILNSAFRKSTDSYGMNNLILHMEKHAAKIKGYQQPEGWNLVDGPILINSHKLAHLGLETEEIWSEPSCVRGGMSIFVPTLYFAFGEGVEEYFMGKRKMRINDTELKELPKDVGSYKEVLRCIGLDIPLRLQTLKKSLEESARKLEEAR